MRQVGDLTLDFEAASRRTGDGYVKAVSDELDHVRLVEEAAALRMRAAEFPKATVRVIDGADHAMMLDVSHALKLDTQFATRAAPDAPAYFAVPVLGWMHGRNRDALT